MIEEVFGAGLAAFILTFLIIFLIVGIIVYVYTALAYMKIADKLNYDKPWLAWIPIANLAMIYQLGGFHWAWVFLVLLNPVPFIGAAAVFASLILSIISQYKIAEQIDVIPAWTVFLTIIPVFGWIWGLVLIGILAWKE